MLDVTRGLLLMVYLTFKYNMQSHVCVLIYIPFEVPCESNTPKADKRRFKIGMHLEKGKNNDCMGGLR